MTREKFLAMITSAATGSAYELSAFREAMTKAGYTSKRGGWVYAPDGLTAMWHGWRNAAVDLAAGRAPNVVRLVLEALPEPAGSISPLTGQQYAGPIPGHSVPPHSGATGIRMIHTGQVPGTHLVPVRAGMLSRLVCGELIGGTLLPGEVDEARVDCLACLDGYVEIRRHALGLPPVANATAGLTG